MNYSTVLEVRNSPLVSGYHPHPHLHPLIRIPLSGVGRHILSVHPLVLAGVKEILDSFRKT
mgnify:CR=1 FL=1